MKMEDSSVKEAMTYLFAEETWICWAGTWTCLALRRSWQA